MIHKNKTLLSKLTKYLRVLLVALLLITTSSINGQTNDTISNKEPQKEEINENGPFSGSCEQQPEYPGGSEALWDFLWENIRYPVEAMNDGIQGRVLTTFVVEKDGGISDIQIARGVHPSLDAEAIRVIGMMPNFKPALQTGKVVRVRFTLPVVFRLSYDVENMTLEEKEKAIKLQLEAENNDVEKGDITVYQVRSDSPGRDYFDYLSRNLKYPSIAQEKGISGVVSAVYDVNNKNEISNIKITESVDPLLDAELIRAIENMPGRIIFTITKGKAASEIEISVHFRLQNKANREISPAKIDFVVVGYSKAAEKE